MGVDIELQDVDEEVEVELDELFTAPITIYRIEVIVLLLVLDEVNDDIEVSDEVDVIVVSELLLLIDEVDDDIDGLVLVVALEEVDEGVDDIRQLKLEVLDVVDNEINEEMDNVVDEVEVVDIVELELKEQLFVVEEMVV